MEKLTDISETSINEFINKVSKEKENLMREVLQKYLGRGITNEDWLKFKIEYSISSEKLFYDEVLLGTTETYFGSDEKDFLRNEFKVMCRFNPSHAIPANAGFILST